MNCLSFPYIYSSSILKFIFHVLIFPYIRILSPTQFYWVPIDLKKGPAKLPILAYGHCAVAVAGKFKKWSKYLGSVLKRCVYDVRSSKKNLGSIGGSLEEPQPKHVHWGLALRFAHYMSFARQFADLKNFTRYV